MNIAVVIFLLTGLFTAHGACARLLPPVRGPIVSSYAPVGSYGGHWGVDFSADPGTPVRAAASGTVTFAGSVAGRLSVTIGHGGGLRTSYSYLNEVWVRAGQTVAARQAVGASGPAHGEPVLHFSVRVGDRYRDPEPWLRCAHSPAQALRLSTVHGRAVYPRAGATRHSRRNLRPHPPRAPRGRRDRVSSARSRHRHVHPGGCSLAEGRPLRVRRRAPLGDDPPRRGRRRLLRGR